MPIYIDQAAAAGKAVLCEKPVDLNSARIRKTLARVEKAGVPLMIGFNRRFDPNFAALQKRLARRRGRRGRAGHHPVARPGAAAGLLYRALRRPVPRHDDPRFRHGALPARRGAVEVYALGSSLVDPAIGKAGDVDTAAVHDARPRAARSARSPIRAAPPMATTSASRCTARRACCRPATCMRRRCSFAGADGITADPVQNFFLERYAAAYRQRARGLHRRGGRRARSRRPTASTG